MRSDNPIRRLRRKFVFIFMALLTLLLFLIIALLNIVVTTTQQTQNLELLQLLVANEGSIPPELEPQYFAEQRSRCIVFLDENNDIQRTVGSSQFPYSEDLIIEYTEFAIDNRHLNIVDELLYSVTETPQGIVVAFLDISLDNALLDRLFFTTSIIGFGSIVLLFIVAILLSYWLVLPVKDSFDSQRRFIADASHELKTPIATISANTDVLIEQYGDVKWLSFIKTETARMQRLVGDLLYLASNEHGQVVRKRSKFNLSDTVALTAMSFEGRAFEGGKRIEMDITPKIQFTGDEDGIKQIVSILLDNAIKHTPNGGTITILLSRVQNRNQIVVKNTGDGIPLDERGRIFERFYRSDTARNSDSKSYGLGLAIAKAIVEQHRGKIMVGGVVGSYAEFKVII